MKGQKKLLLALLVLLGLSVTYAVFTFPRQQRVVPKPPQKLRVQKGSGESGNIAEPDMQVRIDLMRPTGESFAGYRRNIFSFKAPARPRAEVRHVSPPPPVPAVASVDIPPVSLERELARFTFLGFLQKGEEKSIFLAGKNEVFIVREGSRFGPENRFRVERVMAEEMLIRQDRETRPIRVHLLESKALSLQQSTASEVPEKIRRVPGPLRSRDETASGEPQVEFSGSLPPQSLPAPLTPGEVPHD